MTHQLPKLRYNKQAAGRILGAKTKTGEKPGLKRNVKSKLTIKNRGEPEKLSSDYCGEPSDNAMDTVFEQVEADQKQKHLVREKSNMDVLREQLASVNPAVAKALARRQREQDGESSSDEEANNDADSRESIEESDGEEENDKSDVVLNEDSEIDGYDLSETDEESSLRPSDQSISDASGSMSTFASHLGHKLATSEAETLLKRKWSYTWKMPALYMSNCNWRGTAANSFLNTGSDSHCDIKARLYEHWLEIYQAAGGSEFHESRQMSFFSLCNSYCDILHQNKKPFYLKGLKEDSSIMDAYLIHSLNHIFRSRDLLVKNDKKLARQQETVDDNNSDWDDYADRGFTRPKVLFLLPLAGIARRVVKRLIQLTPPKLKGNVENLERFYKEFGSGRTEEDDDDVPELPKSKSSTKPSDYQALIGRDNVNDHFIIGVKFTSRGIKLFGDFYTSDIIVASPLGLITKIGDAEKDKEKDIDYLSSIEILVIDHADIMLMQNWSHVNTVVEKLNRTPSKQHGTDIMRLRPWYLGEQMQFYRQTIILSSHTNPDINALFNHHCLNYEGKVKLECKYKGVLSNVMIPARQIYERFSVQSIVEADDARLKYFCEKVFPKIKDSVQDGVMIYISSYFEYVRLRNFLKSQSASVCLFGEYIQRNDISHVRGQFYRRERKIMLYTERAHFYYRYKIRGVQNLIIYSLPERKEFYPEIVNLLGESDNMNCTVLFSQLDHLRLERIVGSAAAKRMVESDKGIFVFA